MNGLKKTRHKNDLISLKNEINQWFQDHNGVELHIAMDNLNKDTTYDIFNEVKLLNDDLTEKDNVEVIFNVILDKIIAKETIVKKLEPFEDAIVKKYNRYVRVKNDPSENNFIEYWNNIVNSKIETLENKIIELDKNENNTPEKIKENINQKTNMLESNEIKFPTTWKQLDNLNKQQLETINDRIMKYFNSDGIYSLKVNLENPKFKFYLPEKINELNENLINLNNFEFTLDENSFNDQLETYKTLFKTRKQYFDTIKEYEKQLDPYLDSLTHYKTNNFETNTKIINKFNEIQQRSISLSSLENTNYELTLNTNVYNTTNNFNLENNNFIFNDIPSKRNEIYILKLLKMINVNGFGEFFSDNKIVEFELNDEGLIKKQQRKYLEYLIVRTFNQDLNDTELQQYYDMFVSILTKFNSKTQPLFMLIQDNFRNLSRNPAPYTFYRDIFNIINEKEFEKSFENQQNNTIEVFDYKNEPYWLEIEDIDLWTESTYTTNPLSKEVRDWNEEDRELIIEEFDGLIKWASSCEGQEYEHLRIMKEYFIHIDKPNRVDRDKNLVILYDKSHDIIDLYDINDVKEHYFESYLTWIRNRYNTDDLFDKIDNLLSNNTYSR